MMQSNYRAYLSSIQLVFFLMLSSLANADESDKRTQGAVFTDCAICPQMVILPAGTFRMGDLNEVGYPDEQPVRQVTISKAFAVGKYEVTRAEWHAIMQTSAEFAEDRHPVEASWDDATEFVEKLSALTGIPYRLLSEAEWEYAARAGSASK